MRLLLFLLIFIKVSFIYAGTAHYSNGFLDITCATIPPPGFYIALYYSYYSSDEFMNEDGDNNGLTYDLVSKALSTRLVWVSDYKILGADYAMQFSFSADKKVSLEIEELNLKIKDSGVTDPQFTPFVLSWRHAMSDITLTYGLYLPWGNYDKDELVNSGKNHYTHTIALGGTFYNNVSKDWFISVLPRFQFAHKEKYSNIKEGDAFSFEWGLGRNFLKGIVTVGISGHSHWQISKDEGSATDSKDQFHAIGPSFTILDYKNMYKAGIRYYKEFSAEDHYEGDFIVFSLFKKI